MRLVAVIFVTTGQLLYADDPPASPDGSKVVPVTVGGKTIPIRVKETGDPFKNVSSSDSTGKYDPSSINFSATSSMAGKTFSLPSDSISKSSSDFNNPDQNTFITKPYTLDSSAPTAPNLDAKASFPTTSAYSRNAAGFDKAYVTSDADAGQNRPAALGATTVSVDQNRAAVLGTQTTSTFASADSDKTFKGPEADAAKLHLSQSNNGQILINDLPSRPLTIDEVRNLINHGFEPDTNVKPAEPSKPLNDPNYKPEPLRIMPAPDTSAPTGDDDKNDPVPPPGTMAAPQAPENSEPLPQP